MIYLFNTCFAGRILIVNKISLFNGILYHLFKNLINGRYARFYKGVNFTYELILNINHVSLKIYKILCRLLNYNWSKNFKFLILLQKVIAIHYPNQLSWYFFHLSPPTIYWISRLPSFWIRLFEHTFFYDSLNS